VGYGSLLAVPIKRRGQVHEVLCLTLPYGHGSIDDDVNTLELLAAQAAGHLENAFLYEQVNANNNRQRAILDSTRDGIILLDQTGRLIEANVSAEGILGIDLEDYRGENFAEHLMADIGSHEGSSFNQSLRESLTEMARILRLDPQRITKRQIEIVQKGKVRYVEEAGSPVLNSRNEISGRLLTLRDVTEERLLEAYRNEITSMIIHDLRGPLGSIMSSIMMVMEVMDQVDDDTLASLLPISLETGQRLMVMIDSLLDISRLETRSLPLTCTPVSIEELVNEATSSLTFSFQQANITLEQDVSPDLPLVNVDKDKIRRVLINLIDNALRYTPEGGKVLVQVRLSERKVLVRIADTGPGIPADEGSSIFDKFRQLKENEPLRGQKGVGLGLTFCRLAIEAHQERIWIDQDSPLPGACFAFTLSVHN
jgi:two-component system, NtrC family, sensor histidine kinase KinB